MKDDKVYTSRIGFRTYDIQLVNELREAIENGYFENVTIDCMNGGGPYVISSLKRMFLSDIDAERVKYAEAIGIETHNMEVGDYSMWVDSVISAYMKNGRKLFSPLICDINAQGPLNTLLEKAYTIYRVLDDIATHRRDNSINAWKIRHLQNYIYKLIELSIARTYIDIAEHIPVESIYVESHNNIIGVINVLVHGKVLCNDRATRTIVKPVIEIYLKMLNMIVESSKEDDVLNEEKVIRKVDRIIQSVYMSKLHDKTKKDEDCHQEAGYLALLGVMGDKALAIMKSINSKQNN